MMRRKLGFTKWTWLTVFLAVGLLACDDEEEKPADVGPDVVADVVDDGVEDVVPDAADVADEEPAVDPRVAACAEAYNTLAAEVANELADWSVDDAIEMTAPPGLDQNLEADYAGRYRDDLPNHPGCAPQAAYDANSEFLMLDNEATVPAGAPADIAGYPCAAKEYDQPAEDTDLPIVILVHGNSSGVPSFEEYFQPTIAGTQQATFTEFAFTVDTEVRAQLATQLLEAGYRVISFDARTDLVATLGDYNPDTTTGNAFRNIDHGWAVPMLMSLVKAVMTENPTRQVSIIGHSLGTTVIRDTLRRLWIEWRDGEAGAVNPFAQLSDVIMASGANHGVLAGDALCQGFAPMVEGPDEVDRPTGQMRGTVTCEMGDRDAFVPTYFSRRLNGPSDLFAAPCGDGSHAYGLEDQCEGNAVEYTTITMEDLPAGALQDEFVSEASSGLDLEPCVENVLIGLDDFDSSGYFFTGAYGFLANHFGSVRSDGGIQVILDRLAD